MKPVYLNNPSNIELDDAYRGLPKFGKITLKTTKCEQAIYDLEKVGFVGIEVMWYASEAYPDFTIRAFKGKHGPCHFTGWKAKYSGAAFAALDDDNHLLFTDRYKVVCDKTSNIYALPPFEDLIDCKEISQSIDHKNPTDETESGDFEADQSLLYNQLKDQKEKPEGRKPLFYPGPFRFLFLKDGTMVRRGKWSSIPVGMVGDLIREDRFIDLKGTPEVPASFFQEEYAQYGSSCLLDDFKPEAIDYQEIETDFSKLADVSDKFRARLLNIIDNQKKHFILIGNDASDQFGCCPSEEVTDANKLVKYGILDALAEPVQGDSCPVTMYAFKDEISVKDHILSSKINQKIRRKVLSNLNGSSVPKWKKVIKWALLVFIGISLVLAAIRLYNMQQTTAETSMYELFEPTGENQALVILFHNRKRCFQCTRMENLAREVLDESYRTELKNKSLRFETMEIDDPTNFNIIEQYGIYGVTVVFIKFDQKEVVKSKVLNEATNLYRDECAFQEFLKTELHQFLAGNNG